MNLRLSAKLGWSWRGSVPFVTSFLPLFWFRLIRNWPDGYGT